MRYSGLRIFLIGSLLSCSGLLVAQRPVAQQEISLVRYMPDQPYPYKMKDWKSITRKQDSLLYDFTKKGPFRPLIWWDDTQTNFPTRSFGLPSYVGSVRNNERKSQYESLPTIGSVLGASLIGIDKSNQAGNDFVTMCKQFYNSSNGANLVLNSLNRRPGGSFWYEIWPGMSFSMLADQYPDNKEVASVMKFNAENWLPVITGLSGNGKIPDFNYTAFDFKSGKGYYNGRWREPDAAAGLAWLEFAAWKSSPTMCAS